MLQRPEPDEVAHNVVVDGIEVGGMAETELTELVERRAEERGALAVEVVAEDDRVTADRREVGIRYDVDATGEAAWSYGRGWSLSTLAERFEMWRDDHHHLGLRYEIDRERLIRWADDAASTLSRQPRPANAAFTTSEDSAGIDVTDPLRGRTVEPDDLVAAVDEAFERDRSSPEDRVTIEAPVAEVRPPPITEADLETAVARGERAISAPVTLQNDAAAIDGLALEPRQLAEILTFTAEEDADEGERLRLRADPETLRHLLEEQGLDPDRDPTDATFEVGDDEVVIAGGDPGFELDLDAAVSLVTDLVRGEGEDRRGELPGAVEQPEFTREEAEQLGIEERVSSFSTPLVPGQHRNENLALAASLIDGSLILPGETFSLDEAIGERTEGRGFIENGFINEDGQLTNVVGGGVSQMGTTFLNAAWFAGIEIVEFTPHSQYFQRYPMGREATLAWQAIDVVVINDSPHGILIESEGTEEHVEVAFWSSPWAEVMTTTSEPYDVEEGEERDGFTVDFARTVTYPDGSSHTETYTHTYDAVDEDTDDD